MNVLASTSTAPKLQWLLQNECFPWQHPQNDMATCGHEFSLEDFRPGSEAVPLGPSNLSSIDSSGVFISGLPLPGASLRALLLGREAKGTPKSQRFPFG